jgi:hypothetical protein
VISVCSTAPYTRTKKSKKIVNIACEPFALSIKLKRRIKKNENPWTHRNVAFGDFCFGACEAECSEQSKARLFCQASFTEAWTGSPRWAASQDRVEPRVSRYEKLARVRDGDLAVIGRWQDVLDVHYTGWYEHQIL